MDRRVERYIHTGKFRVDGWLHTGAALTIAALGERQQALGVCGGVAEIGVHHGKLFILLYLLSRAPEKAVAIDLYSDQHLNVDESGSGDLLKLRGNLALHADAERLVVQAGNSLDLDGARLTELAGGLLRLISVDGGHTSDITLHDLATADAALCDDGIIILDDAFNEHWPGVIDGARRYFDTGPDLVPFAIGSNKTYFCRPARHRDYMGAARKAADGSLDRAFFGTQVAVVYHLGAPSLRERLVRTSLWQRVRLTSAANMIRLAYGYAHRLRRAVMRREDF